MFLRLIAGEASGSKWEGIFCAAHGTKATSTRARFRLQLHWRVSHHVEIQVVAGRAHDQDDALDELVAQVYPDEEEFAARFRKDLKTFFNPMHELLRFIVEELTKESWVWSVTHAWSRRTPTARGG